MSTDPSQFALVLVDKTTTPETQLPIAAKVDTAAGKYDLVNFVIPGFQPRASNATGTAGRYSIKALSLDEKNTGQLSESGVFEVSKSGVSTTKSGDSPTGTGSGAAVTETAKGRATAGKTVAVAGVAAGVVAAGFVLLL